MGTAGQPDTTFWAPATISEGHAQIESNPDDSNQEGERSGESSRQRTNFNTVAMFSQEKKTWKGKVMIALLKEGIYSDGIKLMDGSYRNIYIC